MPDKVVLSGVFDTGLEFFTKFGYCLVFIHTLKKLVLQSFTGFLERFTVGETPIGFNNIARGFSKIAV